MRPTILFCFLFFLCSDLNAQTMMGRQIADQFPINGTGGVTNGLTWLPQTYNSSTRSYPLIISLHGTGESGTTVADLAKLYNASPRAIAGHIAAGWNATAVNPFTGVRDTFIVVSPQAPSWSYNYNHVKFILPNILSRYRVDTNRIYLTGISAGGAGAYSVFGSLDNNFIAKFAAMSTASAVEVNGVNGYTAQQVEAAIRLGTQQGVRMWTVAGDNDFALTPSVRYHDSTNMTSPSRPNKLTVLAGVGHSAWGRAYDTSFRPVANYYGNTGTCNNGCNNGGIPLAPDANGSSVRGSGVTQDSLNMYEWFLTNQRNAGNNPPPQNPPTAFAGNDQTITLPTSSVTLNGSGTGGSGTITSYLWTKVSGPAATITNAASPTTTITNMVTQGTYVFRLTVTNSNAQTATDDVQVTVNAAQQQGGNCTGRAYTAIPGNDGGYYNVHPLAPGDTLFLDGNYTYSYIFLLNRNGTASCPIVITNKNGVAKLRRDQMNINDCRYLKISGNGGGLQYGIDIRGRNNDTLWNGGFGINVSGKSKCIEISNVQIRNMGIGIKVGTNGDCDDTYNFPNWTIDSIFIHDNKIVKIWNEGMYLGNTSPDNTPNGYDPRPLICNGQVTYPKPARLGNIKVYNNFVDSTGRGGIQLAAASTGISEIYNNVVMHNGMNGDDAQGTAISTGAYTRAKIYGNTISNTYTWGIALLGTSGTGFVQEISNNNIDSSGFMRHYSLATYGGTEVNLATRTVTANALTWPHNIFMKSVNNFYTDSTRFLIKDNTFKRRKGNWNIGMLDNYNTFHKTGNAVCNNINIPSELTSISIEGNIPIYYGTVCGVPQNLVPNANAGQDQSITLPANTVTLNGSGNDPDGAIVSRQWTKVSGPAQHTITSPAQFQTTVTNLVQGVYQFELLVTDNQGATGKDTVMITVNAPAPNQPPTANAGINQTITLPTNGVTLNGSGTDVDGTIVGRQWSKVSGPAQFTITSPTQFQTTVTNLAQGVYQFELLVTDNQGATGRDTVIITVNAAPIPNQPPTADAGLNQTITLPTNSVTLNGSGNDVDGTIVGRQWTKVNGPAQFTITAPTQFQTTVTNLVQGVYQFELMVTDNQGATGRDTVTITVIGVPAPNQPPTANAGINQTITLPTNSVTLSGSGNDVDGTIVGRQWTRVSGPAQHTITSPTQFQTTVTNLVQGVYQFELMVTDNQGATGRDTVTITVNAAPTPNQPPTADAGINQTITLPTNSVTLNGSGNDVDGTIVGRQWTRVGGPAQHTITNPTQFQTTVTNLVQGVYQFELLVTDNQGATGRDTVIITVNASPTPNQPPTANAGINQTITLPTNSVTLNGSGTDVDGTIVGRQWTKVSGPAQFTITNPTQFQTTVTNLVQGVYQFELLVTDNQGATGRDTVIITVNGGTAPPPNQAPTANAGNNQTITLPTNSVTLSGSGNDVDGTIVSRQWTRVGGPAQHTITNPTQFQTTVTNLAGGTYLFELLLTDNQGATGRDTVAVTVNLPPPPPPSANQAPIANAGDTIRLWNKKEATLNGTLSKDNDGIISRFSWKLIKGPGAPNITDPDKSITLINQLIDGTYQVELTVWDNNNASAKDTACVIVKKGNQGNAKVSAKLQPNPVVASTTLRFEAEEEIKSLQITIVDRNGKVIYKDESRPNSRSIYKTISAAHFSGGFYTVYAIINGEQKITVPLIKMNR